MYEVWLMLNIGYEIVLSVLPLVVVGVVLWLALMWMAGKRLGARHIPLSLGLGVLAAGAAFFAVPLITGSSLANMGYWLDWASLAGVAIGFGVLAVVLAWPVVSLLRQPD